MPIWEVGFGGQAQERPVFLSMTLEKPFDQQNLNE